MLYSDAGGSVLGFERDDLERDDFRVVRERTSSSELLESWSTSTKCVGADLLGATDGGRETRRCSVRCSVRIVVLTRGSGSGSGLGGEGGEGRRSSTKDWRVTRTSRGGDGDRRTTRRVRTTRAGIGASSSLTLMRHMIGATYRGVQEGSLIARVADNDAEYRCWWC
jgi:hypothetical protein